MASNRTILVADDDAGILQVVEFALKKAGFEVIKARNGKEALELFHSCKPDLLVLDIMMPELDGIEVCRRIRAVSETPVIFLTSRDDEIDRIVGLEIGGDDYMTKPFSPREMLARVKAVLRRLRHSDSINEAASRQIVSFGSLTLDIERFLVLFKGVEISLTSTEFHALRTLALYPGKVFSRDELMSRIYDTETYVSDRTIDSHIRNIREKFVSTGINPIETVHGVGYRISQNCTKLQE
jgi:two-component system OmpR family response regulator